MSLTSYRTAPPRVTTYRLRLAVREQHSIRFALRTDWRAAPPRVTEPIACAWQDRDVEKRQKGRPVKDSPLTCEWVLTVIRPLQCLATSYSSNA